MTSYDKHTEPVADIWNCTDLEIECPDPEQEWCDWPCEKWVSRHDSIIVDGIISEMVAYCKSVRDFNRLNTIGKLMEIHNKFMGVKK